MRIIIIEPGQPPLIERALSHMIKGLMLDRANRGALEDREAATAAVDQAIALKRHIGEIEDDGSAGVLVVGGTLSFPGLMQIDQACDELFGLDCTPKLLRDAIAAHTATLAVAIAAAMHAGKHMKGVMDSAEALLDQWGEGFGNIHAEADDLRRALDVIEATVGAQRFTTEDMDEAIKDARLFMPGIASWVAAVRASWEAPAAVEIGAPYGEHASGEPRGVEECE